jgi:hypothetical protein
MDFSTQHKKAAASFVAAPAKAWLLLSLASCLITLSSCSLSEPSALQTSNPPTSEQVAEPVETRPALSFLRTEGNRIVDENGDTVILRGCNIGGWLLIEPWIPSLDRQPGYKKEFETEKEIWDLLGKRFGEEKKQELIRTYRTHFFTERDVQRIAELGMNSIRVPIWWRAVTQPEYGGDITWLDNLIEWCRNAGVYVIIDLQGAPGGQAEESANVGEPAHGGALWRDQKNKDLTVEWWSFIAERYRDEPVVAMYDLLNEGTATPRYDDLVDLYDRLYREIRKVDPNHILVMEDVWGFHRLPRASDMGWSNVVYSFHVYAREMDNALEGAMRELAAFNRTALYHGLPIYVGEFNTIQMKKGGADGFLLWRDVFEYYGWSWNFWTWRKIEDNWTINWGVCGYYDDPPVPDLLNDSFEHIRDCFKKMDSKYSQENAMLAAALRAPSRWPDESAIPLPVPGAKLLTLRSAYLLPANNGAMIAEWGYTVPNAGFWKQGDTIVWRFDIEKDGVYEIGIRMANDADGNVVALWIDGARATDIALPNTRGWRSYRNHRLGRFRLAAGTHTLELGQADESGSFVNLQYAWIASSSGNAEELRETELRLGPATMAPLPEKSAIRVEWLNNPPNIGNWDPGQSISWNIALTQPRRYTVEAVYATPHTDSSLRVTIGSKEGGITLPPTAGWQEFATATLGTVYLDAGDHTITATWRVPRRTHTGNLRLIRLVETPSQL